MRASCCIYVSDPQFLQNTIEGILQCTDPADLVDIIVCWDGVTDIPAEICCGDVAMLSVSTAQREGPARLWNMAAKLAGGDALIFIQQSTKVCSNWLSHLLSALAEEPLVAVSGVLRKLHTPMWSAGPDCWNRFEFDMNLAMRGRIYHDNSDSPAITAACIAVTRTLFEKTGGFDDGMLAGDGVDVDYSLRIWLTGGRIRFVQDCKLAADIPPGASDCTTYNRTRIAETWLRDWAKQYYDVVGLANTTVPVEIGCTPSLCYDFEWYLRNCRPDVYAVYKLRGIARGKSVAVICSGPSLDYIPPEWIRRHDIIIGADYIKLLQPCDYTLVTTIESLQAALQTTTKVITPPTVNSMWRSERVFQVGAGVIHIEVSDRGMPPNSVHPPFCNYGIAVHTAVHVALFLDPQEVVIYGCDNHMLGERVLATGAEAYVVPYVQANFPTYEHGLRLLGDVAYASGITLLRVNHA